MKAYAESIQFQCTDRFDSCTTWILSDSDSNWFANVGFGHVHWKVRHGQNEEQVENAIVRFKPVRQASARARG